MTLQPEKFLIFKVKEKKNEKGPDYRITYSEEGQPLQNIGACWKKTAKDGSTFLSCVADKPYNPEVKSDF